MPEMELELPRRFAINVVAGADCITLHDHYDIAWDRIDTPEKILVWVLHLSEKTWVTSDVLQRFVGAATARLHIELPWGC